MSTGRKPKPRGRRRAEAASQALGSHRGRGVAETTAGVDASATAAAATTATASVTPPARAPDGMGDMPMTGADDWVRIAESDEYRQSWAKLREARAEWRTMAGVEQGAMQDTDGIELLDKVRSHTADAEEARTGPHVPCTYVVTGNRVADRGCSMFIARDMDDTDISYVACTNEYEYEHNGRSVQKHISDAVRAWLSPSSGVQHEGRRRVDVVCRRQHVEVVGIHNRYSLVVAFIWSVWYGTL